MAAALTAAKLFARSLAVYLLLQLPAQAVVASAYGSGSYSGCTYNDSCLVHRGFFDRFGWLIFLLIFLLAVFLFLLLRRRRKDKEQRPPPQS